MGKIIGVVRVPVAKILSVSSEWRKAFGFPEPSTDDWKKIVELRGSVSLACINGGRSLARSSFQEEMAYGQQDLVASTSHCLKLAKTLSFYEYLDSRMLNEMRLYSTEGVKTLAVDFEMESDVEEPAVYWVARLLAESFKNYCKGEFSIGIRMDNDLWATDIACRFGYDYIFKCESHDRWTVTVLRNKMTDGTAKKKPRIISALYSYSEEYTEQDIALFAPEGCVVYGDDEDRLDKFGSLVHDFCKRTGISIPLVGFYKDEVRRGEMEYEMTHWGMRDCIMLDKNIRKEGWTYGEIDKETLSSVCDRIGKLK